MALPASLLQYVEQHGCFTGCFGSDSTVNVCLDPARPLQPVINVTCLDCLSRVGVTQALLPRGMTTYQLAQELTDHQRLRRGFAVTRSGYHTAGPGFWLSVAHYTPGLFLISAERSRQLGSDLDVLLLGLQHGVIPLLDPAMRDPKQYRVETVYVNFGQFQPAASKQAFMTSPQCRTQPAPGWQKVTLAEFLPLSSAGNGSQAPSGRTAAPAPRPAAPAKPKAALKIGDRCSVCGAEVRERPLLVGSYVGCLCG